MTLSELKNQQWQRYFPLVLSLVIYLIFQAILMRFVHIAQYDESIYLDVARNIRLTGLPIRSIGEEGFLLLDQTPLYPYMLAGLGLFFGENVFLFRLATVIAGIGTIGLAYKIGLQIRGPFSGLVAALLISVNPFFILYSFFIRMEVFLCFFLMLATYWLVNWEQTTQRKYLLGTGLAIAIAVLFKIVAVFYCGAVVIYVWFSARDWRTRISQTIWLGAPTGIGVALWLSMMLLEPERLQLRLDRWYGAVGGSSKVVDPRMGIASWHWLQSIGDNLLGWGIVTLFVIALFVFLSGRQGRPAIVWMLLLYQVMVLVTSLIIQLKEQRHVIGLIPVTAVTIGLMINWDSGLMRLKKRPLWQGITAIVSIIILWFISPLNFPSAYENPEDWWRPMIANRLYHNDTHLKPLAEAGAYLEQQSKPGEVIIVVRQGPVIGYYANRPYIFLYTHSFDENMVFLEKATFFVLDSQEFWQQSADETMQLMQFINQNFEIDYQTNQNIIVYRRINSE